MDDIFLNACKNGQKGIVEAFVKKGGINYNKRDQAGCTALFYACMKGARDIVKILIDNGADVSLANNESIAPLHAVSKSGNKEIMKLLIDSGADVNFTDKYGKSPLIYTLQENRTEAAKYLISLGADISVKDNEGHTALDYATAHGLRDIIPLLSSMGDSKDSSGNTPSGNTQRPERGGVRADKGGSGSERYQQRRRISPCRSGDARESACRAPAARCRRGCEPSPAERQHPAALCGGGRQ